VVFLTVLTLGLAAQAHAIPQLRLQSSAGADATIADGDVTGAEVDLHAADGVILFSGAIAGWSLNITSGFCKTLSRVGVRAMARSLLG